MPVCACPRERKPVYVASSALLTSRDGYTTSYAFHASTIFLGFPVLGLYRVMEENSSSSGAVLANAK